MKFSAMKIEVMVFWVVTQCSDVVEYHCFRWSCCLSSPWTKGQQGFMKCCYLTTSLHN